MRRRKFAKVRRRISNSEADLARKSAANVRTAGGGQKSKLRLSPTDRREQIIDAAVEFFADVGFNGGTRELANRLGITQPLLYRYFPTKDDLIRDVYKRVYVGRWRSEWEDLITDQSIPLKTRLLRFYDRYTTTTFTREWIRIFLFSGLKGFDINQWWINFVEEHLIRKICAEIRKEFDLPGLDEQPITREELELYWTFHGGIFYYGLRRDVYRLPLILDRLSFIELTIDNLLSGLRSVLHDILKAPRP